MTREEIYGLDIGQLSNMITDITSLQYVFDGRLSGDLWQLIVSNDSVFDFPHASISKLKRSGGAVQYKCYVKTWHGNQHTSTHKNVDMAICRAVLCAHFGV